jgi:hypothetical protein
MNETELKNLVRPLDIGFVSGSNLSPGTWLNRQAGAGWGRMFDRSVATHVFLYTVDEGYPMATEMLIDQGIVEDSAMKYLKSTRDDRMLAIYRWKGFQNRENVTAVLNVLADQRERQVEYDVGGAIACDKDEAPLLFPWAHQSDTKFFCSEQVFFMLQWRGWNGYPKEWEKQGPHPYPLYQQMGKDAQFDLIKYFSY